MRAYTLALSVLAHAIAVLAFIIAPLVATDTLPEPRRTSVYVVVRPVTRSVPTARRRVERSATTRFPAPIPLFEPPALPPPTATLPPFDLPTGGDTGLAPGLVASDVGTDGPLPPPRIESRPPVRVGEGVLPPRKIKHVPPVYPSLARAVKVEGTVILEAVITAAGDVQDVRVLRSVKLLDEAAVDAVRQWRFTPTMLNGEPIPVVMTVTVTFKLQ